MTTCAPLQLLLFPEMELKLTLSAADFRVSPGPSPVEEKEETTTAISGRKCLESSGIANQDGLLAKMSLALMTSDSWRSTECSLTWKTRATKQGRLKFQLAPSMRRTSAPDCSLWPTPVANDDNKTPEAHLAMKKRMKGGERKEITSLQVMAKAAALWPTPSTGDASGSKQGPEGTSLTGVRPDGSKMHVGLATVARALWPTASARDWKSCEASPATMDRNSRPLNEMALWSTIRASDGAKGGPGQKFGAGGTPPPAQAAQAHGLITNGSSIPKEKRGALSPEFVCWMLGFPAEWTKLDPSEIPSSRRSSRK